MTNKISQANPVINYFESIPNEVVFQILSHLSKAQKISLMRVCRLWKLAVWELEENRKDLIKGIGGRIDKYILNREKFSYFVKFLLRSNVVPTESYFLTAERYPQLVNERYEKDVDTAYYKPRTQLKRDAEGVEKEPSVSSVVCIPLIQDPKLSSAEHLSSQHKKLVEQFPAAQKIALPYPMEIDQHPAWHGLISLERTIALLKNRPGNYLFRKSSLHGPAFDNGFYNGTVAVLSHIDNQQQCHHKTFYIEKYGYRTIPQLYQFDATCQTINAPLDSVFLCDLVEKVVQTKAPKPVFRDDIEVTLNKNKQPSLETVLMGLHFYDTEAFNTQQMSDVKI